MRFLTLSLLPPITRPVALGIPNYFVIIKNPMDLGTIQSKFDRNEIDTPDELARLVRLTFQNAITYNTMPDNVVNIAARNLLGIFNKKFGTLDRMYESAKRNRKPTKAEKQEAKRREKEAAKEAKRRAREERDRKRKAEQEATAETKRARLEGAVERGQRAVGRLAGAVPKDKNATVTRNEMTLLVDAVKAIQKEIVALHDVVRPGPSRSSGASSSHAGGAGDDPSVGSEPARSASSKRKRAKKEPTVFAEPDEDYMDVDEDGGDDGDDGDYDPSASSAPPTQRRPPPSPSPPPEPPGEDPSLLEPLSFEDQEALSEQINALPERFLPDVMQIIREADFINEDDDEIDLDIDQLDNRTQRRLLNFVREVSFVGLFWHGRERFEGRLFCHLFRVGRRRKSLPACGFGSFCWEHVLRPCVGRPWSDPYRVEFCDAFQVEEDICLLCCQTIRSNSWPLAVCFFGTSGNDECCTQNVKPKKPKKQRKPKKAKTAAPHPEPSPPPQEEQPPVNNRPSAGGGKSFFALGDDDSDDDKDDDDEDLKLDSLGANWAAPPASGDADKDGGAADDADKDDLWNAAQAQTEAEKDREAERLQREEKVKAEAELAAQKRMDEAAALGEDIKRKRQEEEVAAAALAEEEERRAEEVKAEARARAKEEVAAVTAEVDLDEQRNLMSKLEQEFNDNYSAGASPASDADFGF